MMENTCGVFVFDRDGLVLVCHITGQPWINGKWSIPKGMPDGDEPYLAAAIRELREETGLALFVDDLVPGEPVSYTTKKKTLHPFTATLKCSHAEIQNYYGVTLRCDSMFEDKKTGEFKPEVDSFDWVTVERAKELMHESQVRGIDQFLKDASNRT